MRAIGITVVAPGCDWEAEEAVDALVEKDGTCYLRLDRASAGRTSRPGERFELGRARQLRSGDDVTLIATGGILAEALRFVTEWTDHLRMAVEAPFGDVHITSRQFERRIRFYRSNGGYVGLDEKSGQDLKERGHHHREQCQYGE